MSKKIKNNILKNHKGFTMVEMLVSIAVFVAAITSATAIFIAVINAQVKTNVQRQTMQDARYAIEAITREVRMATGTSSKPAIEYDTTTKILTLNNIPDYGNPSPDIITEKIYLKSGQLLLDRIKNGSTEVLGSAITSSNIVVADFKIDNIVVYDPTTKAKPDRQPSVTITITTRNKTGVIKSSQRSSTTLRTTISSRDYLYTQ